MHRLDRTRRRRAAGGRATHHRAALDGRLIGARVAQRSVDSRALGQPQGLDLRADVAAHTTIDGDRTRPRLHVPRDLTSERHRIPRHDGVAADLTVRADGDLISRTEDVPADLAIDEDGRAGGAHAPRDLAADRYEVGGGDQIAGHAAVNADVVPYGHDVAADGPVDRDRPRERIEIVLDGLAGADDHLVALADIGGRGRGRGERQDQNDEEEDAEDPHVPRIVRAAVQGSD